jgi:hypothetical protein
MFDFILKQVPHSFEALEFFFFETQGMESKKAWCILYHLSHAPTLFVLFLRLSLATFSLLALNSSSSCLCFLSSWYYR